MIAREVMSRDFAVCTEDTPLSEVFRMITDTEQKFITVIESNTHRKPLGIVSEHSICLQIIGKGKSPRGLTAANVMDADLLKADENIDTAECLKMLDNRRFSGLHILDKSGMLCGILVKEILEKVASEDRFSEIGRGAFMNEFRNTATNRIF